MNFDFSKFAGAGSEIESAFGNKKEEVLGSIAKEIEESDRPKLQVTSEVKEEESIKDLADEQYKKNMEFLKQQKEKAKAKEEEMENEEIDEEEEQEEEMQENKLVNKKTSNKKSNKKETKEKPKAEVCEPTVYTRPRPVKAYGEEIYIETNTTATFEDIRKTLVELYGFSEFKDSKTCEIRFNAEEGYVYPHINFNKKG